MRILRYVGSISLCLSVAVSSGLTGALAAESGISTVQGAWLEPSHACEVVFSRAGKGLSFKKPIDMFAPAFIISGNRLTTPQATCRIRSSRPVGERRILTLECANRVAVGELTLHMALAPDGYLKRYFDEQDETGHAYKRCP